jgi:hypothetical protein
MGLLTDVALLENKFKYDVYGKCNQQERKVYPQVKYYKHKKSYHEFCSYKAVVRTSVRCDVVGNMDDPENSSKSKYSSGKHELKSQLL